MSNLVGSVHFNASMDGKKLPEDAKKLGNEAGLAGGKAFSESWDKEFRKGLTSTGQSQLDQWQRRGKLDGLAYGRGLETEFKRFSGKLNSAFDDFQGISVNAGFLDDVIGKSGQWESSLEEMRQGLELLNRQGGITDAQFGKTTATMDRWSQTQHEAGLQAKLLATSQERQQRSLSELGEELRNHERAHRNILDLEHERYRVGLDLNREWSETNTLSDELSRSMNRLAKSGDGLGLSWGNLSHNTRQWTLIIGAVTAALPELAGLSSAAGSGLFNLAGAATAAGIGVGVTISAIVGLNKDINKLPASLLDARSGLDDFKQSFSDLNAVITDRAFANSEGSWRSLGATVRALSPAFGIVGDSVGRLLDQLARGIAPGTKNFDNLLGLVTDSAPLFESLVRTVGRLGEGLLHAFNDPSMKRSMQETVGYIEELTDRFSDFLEGDNLEAWLRHGRAVFGEFGELLDTTGGLLNDLVTDASINRLTNFMDRLGTFLDTGGRGILQFADGLNAFGVVADLLATVGEALEPLREPMIELASVVNEQLGAAIDGLGHTLGALATIAVPAAQGLTAVLDAIPPEAVTVLAGTAAGVAALTVALRGVQGLQVISLYMQGIVKDGAKAATTLGKIGRAAGIAGVAIVGAATGFEAILNVSRKIAGVDDTVRSLASSGANLKDSFAALNGTAGSSAGVIEDWGATLDRLQSTQNNAGTATRNLGLAWDEQGANVLALIGTLNELDAPLAKLAQSSLKDAQSQFKAYGESVGASDAQMSAMLQEMPGFSAVLDDVALQSGGVASQQDLLALALGRTDGAVKTSKTGLQEIGEQATLTKDQVDTLADAIRGFGDTTISKIEATAAFEQSVDDLSQAFVDNGTQLDLNEQKGRDNIKAVLDAVQAAKDDAAATAIATQSKEDANGVLATQRQRIIDTITQFDSAGLAAGNYNAYLDALPTDIDQIVKLDGVATAEKQLADLSRARSVTLSVRMQNLGPQLDRAPMASGGMLYGPTNILAGEAGVEAIVPLDRPLSQVSPDVRWLSAIAQGKTPAAMPGGIGSGKQVVFSEGAIVVQGYFDPRQAAIDVGNEVAERVAS